MTRRVRRVLLAVLAFAAIAPAVAAQDVPAFSAPVVDAARVVPDDAEARVNAELNDYQQRTGNQIAVAVVNTIGNRSLEDYTIDLAREWGVGERGKDNGVVFLIAYRDRRLRIEVGRGLEGELTDLESGRIIRDYIAPRMREGDVGGAIEVGTREIRRALGDTEVGAPVAPAAPEGEQRGFNSGLLLPLFFLVPMLFSLGRRGRRRRWGWATPVFWGGGWGGGWSGGNGGGGGFSGGGGGGFGGGGASGDW